MLEGHTDAVWQLVVSGQKLLSCSSDGSVRLWDPNLTQPLQSTINRTFIAEETCCSFGILDHGIPISIDWLMQNTNQFVATYDSLKTVLFDTETGKVVTQFTNDNSSSDPNYRINRILSHPSQPIIITAHDDKKIRYFDSNSGEEISYSLSLLFVIVTDIFRSNDSFNGRPSRCGYIRSNRSPTNMCSLWQ